MLCLSRCFLVSNSNPPQPEKKGRKRLKREKEIDLDKKQSLHRDLIIPSRQQKSDRNYSSQRGKSNVALGPQLRDMHEAGMGQLALKILHLILFSSQLPSSDSAISQATLLDLATRFQCDICERFDLDIKDKLGISPFRAVNGVSVRRTFTSLTQDEQLEVAHSIVDLLRKINLRLLADGHEGFQFDIVHKEMLAYLLNSYASSNQSGFSELQSRLKKLAFTSGDRDLVVGDIAQFCFFRADGIVYLPGLHGGDNRLVDAAKIKQWPVKHRENLILPKGYTPSEAGE